MEGQFFYFTGENAYALREEVRMWLEQFAHKHGSENLLSLDASNVRLRDLLDEISVAPFIAEKRLVVLRGTPAFSGEEVEKLKEALHPDCILVIADPAPDKRTIAFKAFKKHATLKEFPSLQDKALRLWMARIAAARGATFAPDATDRLLERIGIGQDELSHEIEKLALYASGLPIQAAHVDLLCPPSREQEVWGLTQYLSEGRSRDALRYARMLLQGGEDPISLWNLLLWMLRTLVSVTAAVHAGVRQPAAIASQFKVPFPSARNMLPLAQKIELPALMSLVAWAVETDRELKTGGYKASKEAPEEIVALIDGFILRSAGLGRVDR